MTDGREVPNAALSQRSYLRGLLAKREDIAVYPGDALDSEEPPEKYYFYRPGELLVPSDQLDLFKAVAKEISLSYCLAGRTSAKDSQEGIAETSAQPKTTAEASYSPATSTPDQGQAQKPEPPVQIFVRSASELEVLLERLEAASKNKLNVTPNHVLFASQFWGMDPYGDPTPEANLPAAGGPADGVSVAVIDTGLPEGYKANALLNPVDVGDPTLDFENGPYDGRPSLRYPQGHGCFVAGVVRQVAGGAPVTSYLALDDDGVVDEVDLAVGRGTGAQRQPPDHQSFNGDLYPGRSGPYNAMPARVGGNHPKCSRGCGRWKRGNLAAVFPCCRGLGHRCRSSQSHKRGGARGPVHELRVVGRPVRRRGKRPELVRGPALHHSVPARERPDL